MFDVSKQFRMSFRAQPGLREREAAAERHAYVRTSKIIWAITGILLLVTAALIVTSPMDLHGGKLPLNVATFVVFGPVALVYTYWRFDARIAAICDSVAVLSAFTIVAAAYTYVMTCLGAGVTLWDSRFLAADAALGLDWKAYLGWMNAHPQLGWWVNTAYESILKQMALLILLLVAFGQQRRLQNFMIATQLCILICGAAAAIVPGVLRTATDSPVSSDSSTNR